MHRQARVIRSGRGHLLVALVLAAIAASSTTTVASASIADLENFDLKTVSASLSVTQAGAHPDLTTSFVLNGDPSREDGNGFNFPWGNMRNTSVELPPGITGNAKAFPTCDTDVFVNSMAGVSDPSTEQCPIDSQIGLVSPGLFNFFPPGVLPEPLYNLQSPGRDVVARLGFFALFYPMFIDLKVDPQRDNALTATVTNSPSTSATVIGANVTTWGVPTAASHDAERLNPVEAFSCFAACEPHSSGLAKTAFMSNPTSCGSADVGFAASSYALPNRIVRKTTALPDIENCELVSFEPTMDIRPTSRRAARPSGVDVSLTVPQENISNPVGIRTSDLKSAVVTLPTGVSLNASAADGLRGCSEAQAGLVSTAPVRFNDADAACPDSSKVGTVKIVTPVLEDALEGDLFIAKQGENPFHTLLAGYLVAKGKGVIIKQAAQFRLDPDTGQITAIVDNAPQQPFSKLEMHLKGGARGVIQTPGTCDTYTSHYVLTPWSGNPPAEGTSSFKIDEGCATEGFHPKLSAGVTNPIAGDFSPLTFNVTREDGEQNVSTLSVTLPKGETAKLAGVSLCPDRVAAGGNCPADSQIGSVSTAVGSGALPLWIPQAGRSPTAVYLAGPYQGSPYSVIAKVPAQAGPFDLGIVAVRSAIDVDPETTQITVKSDPLPQILQGIPVSYRDINVTTDRPEFTLNPTSCATKQVKATITSSKGQAADASDRFEVSGCRELGFKPELSLKLRGGTRRGAHPRLRAVLKMKKGTSNLAKVQVALPHSEFLENSHIRTICTRVQFAANRCPAASVYGHASVATPLFDQPLKGPVYLRSSSHELPDLVVDLHGEIHVVIAGRIDSINGGVRNTFEATPDAPFSRFVLEMQGGKKGLLVNSTNLCGGINRARARFVGQNGKTSDFNPVLASSCGGKPGHKRVARR